MFFKFFFFFGGGGGSMFSIMEVRRVRTEKHSFLTMGLICLMAFLIDCTCSIVYRSASYRLLDFPILAQSVTVNPLMLKRSSRNCCLDQ